MLYSERLEFLGLEPLEYRRLIFDLIMMYKIVHNLVDVNRNALINLNSTSFARNSFLKLYKQNSLSSVRAQFLCIVVSMHGIICQKRQDLQHLSMLLKKVCLLAT